MDSTSSKMLKGSWTHCPDAKSLANVIKRLQLSHALCSEVSILPLSNQILSEKNTSGSDLETPNEGIRVRRIIRSNCAKHYVHLQALPPLFAIRRFRPVANHFLRYLCEIELASAEGSRSHAGLRQSLNAGPPKPCGKSAFSSLFIIT